MLLQKNDSNNISNNNSNNNNSNKKSNLLCSLLSTFHVSRTISITSHTLLHLENINKPTIVGHAQGNGFMWSYEEPSKSSEQFKAILQTIILQGYGRTFISTVNSIWEILHWYTIAVLWINIKSKTVYRYDPEVAIILSSASLNCFLIILKYHASEISDVRNFFQNSYII